MEYLEGLFRKFWKAPRIKMTESPYSFKTNQEIKYLQKFCELVFNTNMEIIPSRNRTGLLGGLIYLPDQIQVFNNYEKNRKVAQFLILQMNVMNDHPESLHRRYLEQTSLDLPDQLKRHMATLLEYPALRKKVSSKFVGFFELEKFVHQGILQQVEAQGLSRSHHKQLFDLWFDFVVKPGKSSSVPDLKKLNLKENESIPDFLLLTCAQFNIEDYRQKYLGKDKESRNKKEPNKEGTEFQKPHSDDFRVVSLEDKKKEFNPVMHSFEKIETVDAYEGGYRQTDGEDNLEAHKNALDEVSLNTVTLDGESSKSIYKSDMRSLHLFQKDSSSQILEKSKFVYSEWDEDKRAWIKDHCQLIFKDASDERNSVKRFSLDEINIKKSESEWRPFIESLLHQPAWKKNLREGSEIDYDAYLRFRVNHQAGHLESNPRVFAEKSRLFRDIGITFLFDQSLSTDSYVEGRRVLETISEALVVAGRLFSESQIETEVASFWSASRWDCHYSVLKLPQQKWEGFDQKMQSLEPVGYTRMGPALRHGTLRLKERKNEKKFLFVLTDGKPTDIDGYEGRRGIYDVRKAIHEAECLGISVFVLTLDQNFHSYYDKMFRRFRIVQRPEHLSREMFQEIMNILKS